ncbi:TPM domain-containing protein [bacterium]|nr:TPM domain-containing protein [bacterium]
MSWKPFKEEEEQRILQAIKEAELKTSGELRVHIDRWCKTYPDYKAANIFKRLEMEDTDERNGVLIYVALDEHKFAILGDKGINEKVPENFWDSTAEKMTEHFKAGRAVDAIVAGVKECGEQLAKFFPYKSDDINELPDDISYGA